MIRKTLWFVSVVSLALAPAFASAGGDKSAKDAGKSTSLTGCLAGTSNEGVYELKTKSGATAGQTKAVEVRGQANLKEHVGHEVKLTGSWMEGSSRTSDAGSAETEKEAARTQTENRHFMVTDIQHVADSCKTK